MVVAASFQGPLPPPEVMERYEQIVPGAGSRIINQFEQQGTHRREMESYALRESTSRAHWGLVAGFVVAMTTIIGGVVIIVTGHSAEGLAALVLGLVSLVGVFVYGRYSQSRERIEKAKANPDRRPS